MIHDGEADLCVVTPNKLMPSAINGTGIFAKYGPMPHLRALATLPQRDRMILAVHPKFGVQSFDDIRQKKPKLHIATSADDGTSFIGHVATILLTAHGIDEESLKNWGGNLVKLKRPDECIEAAVSGKVDALIQEAIMLSGWNELIERQGWIPIPVEKQALQTLSSTAIGYEPASLPKEHWATLKSEILALDFSDFLLVVRDDMPDDVVELLTWCLIHTRHIFERQFQHIPPEKCMITYPINPVEMAKTSIELHSAAKRVYEQAGILE